MEKRKITKKDVLNAIACLVKADVSVDVDYDGETVTVIGEDILDYVDTTLEQLDTKAKKARERAAANKAEGDKLRDAVKDVLTDDFQTIDDIAKQVDYPEITKSKITARLTQLVKAGVAKKEQIKVENRKIMGYARIA